MRPERHPLAQDDFADDLDAVARIDVVPKILEVESSEERTRFTFRMPGPKGEQK